MKFNFADNFEFEAFVRKIAKECWGATGYTGPITIDGRERDGVLEGDHQIYCLEVTTARNAKHTQDSCQKTAELVRRLRGLHPDKGVTGWYITRHEATGDQGAILSDYKAIINHRTYDAFYASMVDAKDYLLERAKKPFGSIRSPETDRFDVALKYTPTKILNTRTGEYLHTGSLAKLLSKGATRALVTGEFGAGKSMALRDIFQRLSQQYRTGGDSQFPVYVNLRDHIEQYDPDECLRRHASSVGMATPEKLIRAWRSGLVYLLLDGFDELSPRVATSSRKRAQDLRNSAISLVRRLVDETPAEGSIILAGRNNYFDTNDELFTALGITNSWKTLEIHDLDDEDLARFISDHGWGGGLPEWVPKKPLLISYVKQNGLIDGVAAEVSKKFNDPTAGWDFLVDKICEREVNQVYVALEPSELRRIFGRLATFARKKIDRRGPLSFSDCRRAFIEVTGVEPEERSVTAILRLPGLSGALNVVEMVGLERGSRFFVDPDLADILSAEDVSLAICLPYECQVSTHEGVIHPLGELGCSLVYCKAGNDVDSSLGEAFRKFSEQTAEGARKILADLIKVAFANGARIPQDAVFSNVYLNDVLIDGDSDFSNLTFHCCAFERLDIEIFENLRLPKFEGCQIETLIVPSNLVEQTDFMISNNNHVDRIVPLDVSYGSLRQEGAPENFLDLVSVIDKVFIQSQSGRIRSAIYRGRPAERRVHLDRVLNKMAKRHFVYLARRGGIDIVVPNMSKVAELKSVIARKDFAYSL